MQDFRKLRVWEEGQQFAAEVYGLTRGVREIGSLRGQLRRSAESIPSNIAEGARRKTPNDFAHFLQTAIASASECESQLDLLRRLHVVPAHRIDALIKDVVRVRRQMIALRKRVLAPPDPCATPEPHTPKRLTPN